MELPPVPNAFVDASRSPNFQGSRQMAPRPFISSSPFYNSSFFRPPNRPLPAWVSWPKEMDSGCDTEKVRNKVKISLKDFQPEQLKIVLGKEKCEVFVSKALICVHSEFFKAACDKRWQSGRENTVTLENEDPQIFAIFLAWIITGDIEKSAEYIEVTGTDRREKERMIDMQWTQLARCFILGDVLLAAEFQNEVIDLLLSKNLEIHEDNYSTSIEEQIRLAFGQTMKGSGLRNVILDNFISNGGFGTSLLHKLQPDMSKLYFQDFWASVIARLPDHSNTKSSTTFPLPRDMCAAYHQHPTRPKGYSCGKYRMHRCPICRNQDDCSCSFDLPLYPAGGGPGYLYRPIRNGIPIFETPQYPPWRFIQ